MNEEINKKLHEAVEAHQPDFDRMLARVERGVAGTAGRHRTPGIAKTWPRVALAGLAAAGILATGGLAVASIVHITPPPPDSATSATATSPSSTPDPSDRTTYGSAPPLPSQQAPTTEGPSTSVAPDTASPTGNRVSGGPLSAEGSIGQRSQAYWTQSNLVLNTTQPLTALTVELRIAQTGGVQTTGQWQTEPSDDFTITVQEVDGTLVYRWDLKPGRTMSAAQQTFAAQYNHGNGARDARADSYTVQATADGTHSVRGGFTPAG